MEDEKVRRVAGLLARAVARRAGKPFPAFMAESYGSIAIESVLQEAGASIEALPEKLSTKPGIFSRYVVVNAEGGGDPMALVAYMDYRGWAGAALMTAKQLHASGLGSPRVPADEYGILGVAPLIAVALTQSDTYRGLPDGTAYACRAEGYAMKSISRRAYAHAAGEVDKAIERALEALKPLPDHGCDAADVLRGMGWKVETINDVLKARLGVGDRFVAVLELDGPARVPNGLKSVGEKACIEACGSVVELDASAPLAYGVLRALEDAGMECRELGRQARLRVGAVHVTVEAPTFAAACPIVPRGYSPILHELSYLAGNVGIPLACRHVEGSAALIIARGAGALAFKVRVGSLETVTPVHAWGDLAVIAVAPLPAEVAAIAGPGGVEVVNGDEIAGPVTQE